MGDAWPLIRRERGFNLPSLGTQEPPSPLVGWLVLSFSFSLPIPSQRILFLPLSYPLLVDLLSLLSLLLIPPPLLRLGASACVVWESWVEI